jgi:hypothetical protein
MSQPKQEDDENRRVGRLFDRDSLKKHITTTVNSKSGGGGSSSTETQYGKSGSSSKNKNESLEE